MLGIPASLQTSPKSSSTSSTKSTSVLQQRADSPEKSKTTSTSQKNGFVRSVAVAGIFKPVADDEGFKKPAVPEKRRFSALIGDLQPCSSAKSVIGNDEFSRRRQSWDTRSSAVAPFGQNLLRKTQRTKTSPSKEKSLPGEEKHIELQNHKDSSTKAGQNLDQSTPAVQLTSISATNGNSTTEFSDKSVQKELIVNGVGGKETNSKESLIQEGVNRAPSATTANQPNVGKLSSDDNANAKRRVNSEDDDASTKARTRVYGLTNRYSGCKQNTSSDHTSSSKSSLESRDEQLCYLNKQERVTSATKNIQTKSIPDPNDTKKNSKSLEDQKSFSEKNSSIRRHSGDKGLPGKPQGLSSERKYGAPESIKPITSSSPTENKIKISAEAGKCLSTYSSELRQSNRNSVSESSNVKSVSEVSTVKTVSKASTVTSVSEASTVKSVSKSSTVKSVSDASTVKSVSEASTVKSVSEASTVKSVSEASTVCEKGKTNLTIISDQSSGKSAESVGSEKPKIYGLGKRETKSATESITSVSKNHYSANAVEFSTSEDSVTKLSSPAIAEPTSASQSYNPQNQEKIVTNPVTEIPKGVRTTRRTSDLIASKIHNIFSNFGSEKKSSQPQKSQVKLKSSKTNSSPGWNSDKIKTSELEPGVAKGKSISTTNPSSCDNSLDPSQNSVIVKEETKSLPTSVDENFNKPTQSDKSDLLLAEGDPSVSTTGNAISSKTDVSSTDIEKHRLSVVRTADSKLQTNVIDKVKFDLVPNSSTLTESVGSKSADSTSMTDLQTESSCNSTNIKTREITGVSITPGKESKKDVDNQSPAEKYSTSFAGIVKTPTETRRTSTSFDKGKKAIDLPDDTKLSSKDRVPPSTGPVKTTEETHSATDELDKENKNISVSHDTQLSADKHMLSTSTGMKDTVLENSVDKTSIVTPHIHNLSNEKATSKLVPKKSDIESNSHRSDTEQYEKTEFSGSALSSAADKPPLSSESPSGNVGDSVRLYFLPESKFDSVGDVSVSKSVSSSSTNSCRSPLGFTGYAGSETLPVVHDAGLFGSVAPRPPERKRVSLLRDSSLPPPLPPHSQILRTGSLKRFEDSGKLSFDKTMSILKSPSHSCIPSYTPHRYSYTEMLSKVCTSGISASSSGSAIASGSSGVTKKYSVGSLSSSLSQVSELWSDLNQEQSSSAHTAEMLESETSERMRLEKEMQELQSKFTHMQQKSDKMEMEMIEARVYRSNEVNGDVSEDDDSEASGSIYKAKYERAVRDMEIMKRRVQQQHEEEAEQALLMKKASDKKLAEALEDVEEERQVANQWKKKAQKLNSELQDLRLMLEEQMARNGELEKRQRRFDSELSACQEEAKKEKLLREKMVRERDQALQEKYSMEQEVHATRLDMDMLHEKVTQLSRELDELTLSSKGEEEVTQLKRAKQELERKCRDQDEELEELAGQVQMLEQAKLRLEMSLEKLRQEHRRENSVREEEIEELRASFSKKIKNLEAQLETEQEDRHQLVKQKHELERRIIELTDQPPPQDPEIERRLRRDLKRTRALLKDAQAMLEHVRDGSGSKSIIRQLKNQVEDAEFAKCAAVKAKQNAEMELHDAQTQLEEITRTKNESESRCLQLSREKSALQTQLEETEEEMAEVMKKYKATVAQTSIDQKTISEQSQQIAELESEKMALREQLSEVNTKFEHLAGQSEDTQRVYRLDGKVRELESKLELEQTTKNRLEHQITRLKEQIDRQQEECDSLRNKEVQAQEACRRLQRQIRELREDYTALQQKEADAYRKQHELEAALENAEGDLKVTKNDLRLACQRIDELKNALEDDLDSGTDVPDDSGSDSDSSYDMSSILRHSLSTIQRCDSASSDLSLSGRRSLTPSMGPEFSALCSRGDVESEVNGFSQLNRSCDSPQSQDQLDV